MFLGHSLTDWAELLFRFATIYLMSLFVAMNYIRNKIVKKKKKFNPSWKLFVKANKYAAVLFVILLLFGLTFVLIVGE